VASRSLADGLINFSNLSSQHAGGSYESIDLNASRSLLRLGANQFAVELHQSATNDTNIVWDAELTYQTTPFPMIELAPFRITAFAHALNFVTVEWESLPGATYRIQRSEALVGWNDCSEEIAATNTLTSLTLPVSNQTAQAFYRITIVP
jgi:hypothetical protein